MELDLHKLKDELEKLLRDVGGFICEGFRNEKKEIMIKPNSFDIVTEYDIKVNRIIVEFLEQKYPNFNIISEEENPVSHNSDYSFHIDPIDGTRNFSRGVKIFFSGIAFAKGNDVILSTCYDPLNKDFFYAIKGEGAFLNDKKIVVGTTPLENSDLFINARPKSLKKDLVNSFIEHVHKVRDEHCCFYEITGVASNKFDGFITTIKDNTWDVAQYLIVREAGGKVTDWKGDEFDLSKKGLVASNGLIHEELLKITRKFA